MLPVAAASSNPSNGRMVLPPIGRIAILGRHGSFCFFSFSGVLYVALPVFGRYCVTLMAVDGVMFTVVFVYVHSSFYLRILS
jgi:hypothetical protein